MGKYPAKISIMKWIKNHNQRKQSGREGFMIKEQTTREKILESGKKWFLASGFKSRKPIVVSPYDAELYGQLRDRKSVV